MFESDDANTSLHIDFLLDVRQAHVNLFNYLSCGSRARCTKTLLIESAGVIQFARLL